MTKYIMLYLLFFNLGLLVLIGFGVWYLDSMWPFIGLIFMKTLSYKDNERVST